MHFCSFCCSCSLTRKRGLLLTVLFCLGVNSAAIIPWYIPHPTAAYSPHTSGQPLRILLSNVNIQNRSYDKVLTLVRQEQPDVAIFMEINNTWVNQLQALADLLPYKAGRANPDNFDDTGVYNRLPLDIGVYSRLPLSDAEVRFFDNAASPPSIVTRLTVNKQVVTLLATHPLPPIGWFDSRNRQLAAIGRYVQTLNSPVVVVGDLNITMWSPYYRQLIRKTGLRNGRHGFGLLPTWPTAAILLKASLLHPPKRRELGLLPTWLAPATDSTATLDALTAWLRIPIDHCLVSPNIRVVDIRTGPNIGSDHLPLITDIHIEG